MDPVTVVTTALAAGAAAGVKDTAAAAVNDAYTALKSLVLRRVNKVPGGTVAIEQHEHDPPTWSAPVAKVLSDSGAAVDPEVLSLAQHLLTLLKVDVTTTTNIIASGERSVAAHTITGTVGTGDK